MIKKERVKSIHISFKGVEPSKMYVREILYNWCVLMFNIEIQNRECLVVHGCSIMKKLKCRLKRAAKAIIQHTSVDYITSISGCMDGETNDGSNSVGDDGNGGKTV